MLLLFVTLLPANSALAGDYPTAALAVSSMAANIVLIQFTALWMSWYAWKAHLMDERIKPAVWHRINRNNLMIAVTFLLSIPVAFFDTQLATALWLIALGCMIFLVQRNISQRLARSRTRRAEAERR